MSKEHSRKPAHLPKGTDRKKNEHTDSQLSQLPRLKTHIKHPYCTGARSEGLIPKEPVIPEKIYFVRLHDICPGTILYNNTGTQRIDFSGAGVDPAAEVNSPVQSLSPTLRGHRIVTINAKENIKNMIHFWGKGDKEKKHN